MLRWRVNSSETVNLRLCTRVTLQAAGAEGVCELAAIAACEVVLTSLPDDEALKGRLP
jgi:hypothetical protein